MPLPLSTCLMCGVHSARGFLLCSGVCKGRFSVSAVAKRRLATSCRQTSQQSCMDARTVTAEQQWPRGGNGMLFTSSAPLYLPAASPVPPAGFMPMKPHRKSLIGFVKTLRAWHSSVSPCHVDSPSGQHECVAHAGMLCEA
eukprot:363501-Chlamydomonas_euryale.AAC.9